MTTGTMRILHCVPTLGGGGAERQLACLSEQMSKDGASVHVAYTRPGPNFDRLRKSGVVTHELACRSNYDPRILWQLLETIQRVRPQVIQTWLTQMDVLGGLASILTNTPFILSEQSSSKAYVGKWKDRLRLLVGRRAFAVIANSLGGKEYWQKIGRANRVEVIRNGIPLSEILTSTRLPDDEAGVNPSAQVILWAGRYRPEKNPLLLMRAVPEILSECKDAVVVFFGAGPLEGDLLSLAERSGMGRRVRIEGFSTNLWSWMRRAGVFVSTSVYEGSPNAVCEAAAAHCPLILSDIPQHRELLSDDSASFFPLNDPPALARSILSALRDPGQLKRKAEAAYGKLSKWTVESVTGEYLSLYWEAASEGRSSLSESMSAGHLGG